MRTPIYIKSLCRGTPAYAWTAGRTWESVEPTLALPSGMFLSNDAGIKVGVFGSVDVDSFRSLLGNLPYIHTDLYLDAVEVTGLRSRASISGKRWRYLAKPRPVPAPRVRSGILTLYAAGHGKVFELNLNRNGSGGWFEIPALPKGMQEFDEVFDMWEYTVYVPIGSSNVRLPATCARKLITSTFDNLYTYNERKVEACSYLAYARPIIDAYWERRKKACADSQEPD